MATPLHTTDTLVSLATAQPGIARDWASARLALQAPDQFNVFPTSDEVWDVVLAAGPAGMVRAMQESLQEEQHSYEPLAAAIAGMAAFGVLPEESGGLADGLKAAMGSKDTADLWLAWALVQLGEADGSTLVAAASTRSEQRDWLLPIVVLNVAQASGALDEAAGEIARGMRPLLATDPSLLASILGGLGVPLSVGSERHYPELREPEGAADFGAYLANGALPDLPKPKGSRRRRVQAWIHALLDGVEHPAAALLRSLYAEDANLDWGMWPLTAASWLRCYVPLDPIEDVMNRNAGGDGPRLAAARRMALDVEPEAIFKNLSEHGNTSAAVIAMPHVVKGDAPELADAIIKHVVDGAHNARAIALATAASWYRADAVPELINSRDTRDLGLLLAEWIPTEQVLASLLELEVPSDPDARLLYARGLAQMGDQAAVPTLVALLEEDKEGHLLEARHLAEGILGQGI